MPRRRSFRLAPDHHSQQAPAGRLDATGNRAQRSLYAALRRLPLLLVERDPREAVPLLREVADSIPLRTRLKMPLFFCDCPLLARPPVARVVGLAARLLELELPLELSIDDRELRVAGRELRLLEVEVPRLDRELRAVLLDFRELAICKFPLLRRVFCKRRAATATAKVQLNLPI